MNVTFGISLPAEVRSVPYVRALCRTSMSLLQVEEQDVEDVVLALSEACANVVQHSDGLPFDVNVSIDGDRCRIDVTDTGGGFDPDLVAERDRQRGDLLESGRGIALMRSLVDDLEFVRAATGTTVTFEKRLTVATSSPLLDG